MAAAPHLSNNGKGTFFGSVSPVPPIVMPAPANEYVALNPGLAPVPATPAPATPARFARHNNYTTRSNILYAPLKPLRAKDQLSFDVQGSEFFDHHGPSTFTFPDGTTLGDYIDSEIYKYAPKLGAGMSGTAYRVDKGGKSYVLKHITNTRSVSMEVLLREIEMLTRVYGKWFAVQLLAAQVQEDGIAWLLFPYIPGKELFDVIEPFTKRKATAEETAYMKYLYNTLLDGVHQIHEMGIIHRDIKPENVWVPSDPSIPPFFLDFGLAATGEVAIPVAGTRMYVRPERLLTRSRVPSENDNYYAFAVMSSFLPEMLDPAATSALAKPGLTRNAARHIKLRRGGRRTRRSRKQ